ncbi:unnamed protein product [Candida verbasci]|uniref:Uncharacterized protein n=1 Tax=Candida verbasci TaxID=1227364 RepID=A0A9W4XEW1_9ASCO|nr:unnamed protein product [Candida verbasci]
MASNNNNQTETTIYQTLDELGISPIPSFLLGSSLIFKGLLSSGQSISKIPNQGTSGSSFKFNQKLSIAKPTRLSCFTFGGASLLGSWMLYDGDPLNASGFNMAWSGLYLLVNGKSSIKSVIHGRLSPILLSSLALFNTGLYGREFFWSKQSPFK